MCREVVKGLAQFRFGRNGALDQIGRGHDFGEFGRPSFRRQGQGEQEERINIVDGVHRITFENLRKKNCPAQGAEHVRGEQAGSAMGPS